MWCMGCMSFGSKEEHAVLEPRSFEVEELPSKEQLLTECESLLAHAIQNGFDHKATPKPKPKPRPKAKGKAKGRGRGNGVGRS